MTLLRQLVFLASWRPSVRHFFTQRREVAKEERSAMRDLIELSGVTGTLPVMTTVRRDLS